MTEAAAWWQTCSEAPEKVFWKGFRGRHSRKRLLSDLSTYGALNDSLLTKNRYKLVVFFLRHLSGEPAMADSKTED